MCRLQKQTTFRKTKRRLNIRGRKLKMKMKIHGFILFLLFCEFRSQPYPDKLKSSQQIFDASKDSNQETNTIKIGIILDTRSWVGEVVQSCLTMAISEFYMLNEQYKTRIALEPRDSRGEPFRSIASAFDLLENAQVHAIMVPEMSSEESFLVTLCDKANVPLLSFSSVSSSNKHPYFLQVAQDETSQFKGVAAFLRAFKWRNVVLIYEDTEDTRQILSHLHDTFRDSDLDAVNDIAITLKATDEEIIKKLHNLRTMRTSIIIVHTSVSLSSQIFKNAKMLEMMSEDYAWIMTSKTMNLLDLQDSPVFESMGGAVGFRPYIPASSKLRNFTLRWRREFQRSEIDMESRGLNVFGIWAYDAVWALAEAIERAGTQCFPKRGGGGFKLNLRNLDHTRVSNSGSTLLNEISRSNFTGLGGEFQLINARLVHETYEIVNVIGKGGRRVGFWTPTCGFTKEIYQFTDNCSSDGLETIIWPGFSTTAPKGWLLQMSGRRLRIGVPANTRFPKLIGLSYDQQTNKATTDGFCMDVFNAAIERLLYKIDYEFIPLYGDNGSYSDHVYNVYLQIFDAAVGDITITSNRSQYVDFTLPFTEFGVGMVARLDDKDPWFFLKPLSVDLWIMSAGFFILTGFIVWLIEHRINVEFQGSLGWQIGTILWFAASTLVYAHREKLQSNLSRFVVGIWLFVVLILTSSYTANLSSLLTVQQIRLTKNDYIGYPKNSFSEGLHVNNLNFQDNRLKPYSSLEDYYDALRKGSKNGGVGAIIDEIPYIKLFLAKYPHEFAMINSSETTNGFAFAFKKGSPLVHDMSRAIAGLREEGKILEMEKKWFRSQLSPSSGTEPPRPNTLGINSFSGLFLVSGISLSVALLLFLILVLHKKLSSIYSIISMLAGGKLISIFRYFFCRNRLANRIG
ncbi:glutamate receptor 1.2-like [Olea europaea var. sylvestris]|uniref:glutamate receptor 1.2-like n=1 Tax=Olea europaea var. sylvestris TaxID=158386 RepID=UPI000C1D4B66|nr:glutamate receptor 1.2-like [Olea europaea var. sylvestris]